MYFSKCKTVEEVKNLFRTLAKEHHPDLGGDTATMQNINEEYHNTLRAMSGQTSQGDDGTEYTYQYSRKVEQEIMDKIMELLAMNMKDVEVWLIGKWIWLRGDTKPHKEQLKEKGCSWHAKRVCWYWKPAGFKRSWSSKGSLSEIAARYGATHFESQEKNTVTA